MSSQENPWLQKNSSAPHKILQWKRKIFRFLKNSSATCTSMTFIWRKHFFSAKETFLSAQKFSCFEQTPSPFIKILSMPRKFFTTQKVVRTPVKFSSTAKKFFSHSKILKLPKNSSGPQKSPSAPFKMFSSVKISHHLQKNLSTLEMSFSVRNKSFIHHKIISAYPKNCLNHKNIFPLTKIF